MSECFIGEIRMFAGNYSPENWVLCNGQALSVSQFQTLFSLIGTTYGGDGKVNFNVPDLRGRIPVGQGTNAAVSPPLTGRTLGQQGGEEAHTLVESELAAHSHPVHASLTNATTQAPGPTVLYGQAQNAGTSSGLYCITTPPDATVVQFDATAVTYVGGNQSHPNVMTTTAITFIMATSGTYPPRPN